eukprot:TRINITY_DN30338_c0_g1_i2.p2 TRINITY_DN30338_c0_g1~~TRINITY_DN30338_c0_g1_i2.p2  ORF type:complete len:102 (+),score=21.53 TRINITY_DN30338_c0_g1_i2:561-866(+)
MHRDVDKAFVQMSDVDFIALSNSDEELLQLQDTWRQFSVDKCNCAFASDKNEIMNVIAQYPGGSIAFDSAVKELVAPYFDCASEFASTDTDKCDADEIFFV